MKNERLIDFRLDLGREIGLRLLWIDKRIPVVLEHKEIPIHSNIDAAGLNHLRIKRIDLDAPEFEGSADGDIAQNHVAKRR